GGVLVRRNVELKARCPDPAAVRRALAALKAEPMGTVEQADTYFAVPDGRLKLRESTPGQAELIFYRRSDAHEARPSEYHLAPVACPERVAGVLAAALGVRGRVRKTRHWWLYRNIRVHLDEVEGLGAFVELEAMVGNGHTEADCAAAAEELAALLGVAADHRLAGSYVELLAAAQ
ncbi:MAG TPA: class IV adenylate cyclase, partial [Gemmataceae bacterium]